MWLHISLSFANSSFLSRYTGAPSFELVDKNYSGNEIGNENCKAGQSNKKVGQKLLQSRTALK